MPNQRIDVSGDSLSTAIRELGLTGCSPHSGCRTFITNAARLVFRAGGRLRDVQQLAGHQSIEQTQAHIDDAARAKRRLIELM